ncbi:hypothetical protein TNCV_3209091 [Trichonephila clavipes]|nr:hypothetical protein TNCV_3209091 [Trichonephila clavipes]
MVNFSEQRTVTEPLQKAAGGVSLSSSLVQLKTSHVEGADARSLGRGLKFSRWRGAVVWRGSASSDAALVT